MDNRDIVAKQQNCGEYEINESKKKHNEQKNLKHTVLFLGGMSQLQKMSCIDVVLAFLCVFDQVALIRCRKAFKQKCNKHICHTRVWDDTFDCNPNDVWKFQITLDVFEADLQLPNNVKDVTITSSIKGLNTGIRQLVLPSTITALKLKCVYFLNLTYLPPNIKTLILDNSFGIRNIQIFPTSLISLKFSCNQELMPNMLPTSLLYLDVVYCFGAVKVVENTIPKNVCQLSLKTLNKLELHKNCFPPHLKQLTLDGNEDSFFTLDCVLPAELQTLTILDAFSNVNLPPKLRSLILSDDSCHLLRQLSTFPPSLTEIRGSSFAFRDFAPETKLQLSQLKRLSYLSDTDGISQYLTHIENLVMTGSSDIFAHIENFTRLHSLTISDFNEFTTELEMLTNLKKLEIYDNHANITFPKNLSHCRIRACQKMQNMSYLTELKKLHLSNCQRHQIKLHNCYFPLHLQSFKLHVHDVVLNDEFPHNLRKLTICVTCPFKFACLPSGLLKLSLSFLPVDLDQMLPKSLQLVRLPIAIPSETLKFPNVRKMNPGKKEHASFWGV